jgi:hypothetical protein
MNINDCLNNYDLNNIYALNCNNIFHYHKVVEMTFFSIGFVSMGGITFYYIRNKFGKIIKAKMIDGIWNLLKLETIARMSLTRVTNTLYKTVFNIFINPIKYLFVKPEEDYKDVSYYMNGRLVKKMAYIESLNYNPQEEYNLIIYKIINQSELEDTPYYLKIFDNHEDINDNFELSQLKFISTEILIDGIDQKITLNLSNQNMYLQGNKLFTRPFITWFLMEKLGINLKEDTKYTVYTIDNQINMDKFENNSSVIEYAIVTENGYDKEIINKNINKIETSPPENVNEDLDEKDFEIQTEVVLNDKTDTNGILSNVIYSWFGYNK